MKCPTCLEAATQASTRVLESRQEVSPAGPRVRRRRECERCQQRFTTIERMELGLIIDAQGQRRSFAPERLRKSLDELGLLGEAEIGEVVRQVHARVKEQADIDSVTLMGWVAGALPSPTARAAYLRIVARYSQDMAERAASGQVIKRDGSTCWFERQKLRTALERAAHTLVDRADLEKIGDVVEQRIIEAQAPVKTQLIREWVDAELRRLDERAWLRYAAGQPQATWQELLRLATRVPNGHIRKGDGSLDPFDRERLQMGIELALGQRPRTDQFWRRFYRFVDSIAEEVRTSPEAVTANTISNRVLRWLKENNELEAFLSYLAGHRDNLQLADVTHELARWGITVPAH